jgi:hypothetical protein
MLLSVPAGTTSKDIVFPVYDSSSTVGALLAGLVYNTGSLVAYYSRQGVTGNPVSISLATKTKGTWATSGFVTLGTGMTGMYELGVPDAALAAGATWVMITLAGAANMVPVCILIELTATNNQDSVRGGMTALPNAAAAASGGLIINGSNTGTVTLAAATVTGALTVSDGIVVTCSTGSKSGIKVTGGATAGIGVEIIGTGTGDGIKATGGATNSNGMTLQGTGTGKGLLSTGGAGALGDGISAVAGGGVDIRGNQTGNITGNLSGTTGAVASVTGNVGGNVVGSVGSVVATIAANLTQILGTALTETAGYLANGFKSFFNVLSGTLTIAGVNQTGDSYGIVNNGSYGNAQLVRAVAPATALNTANANTLSGHDPGATLVKVADLGTVQSGDSYPIVNHTDYGNAKLVRAVTPATTFNTANANTLSSHDPGATLTKAGDAMAVANGGIQSTSFAAGAIDAGAFAQAAADKVWATATRTLTSFGTLVSDVATAVWGAVSRTLTAFAFTPSLDAAYNAAKTAAQAGDAMTLTGAERNATADALLDRANAIETSITLRQAFRLALSVLAGKLSGAATTTITIRNVGDTKNRIIATVDADGNRSAITTDVS